MFYVGFTLLAVWVVEDLGSGKCDVPRFLLLSLKIHAPGQAKNTLFIMSQIIDVTGGLLRICPKDPKKLECSKNDGRTWSTHFIAPSSYGEFEDLKNNGNEILATTSKGLFASRNEGRSWSKRY